MGGGLLRPHAVRVCPAGRAEGGLRVASSRAWSHHPVNGGVPPRLGGGPTHRDRTNHPGCVQSTAGDSASRIVMRTLRGGKRVAPGLLMALGWRLEREERPSATLLLTFSAPWRRSGCHPRHRRGRRTTRLLCRRRPCSPCQVQAARPHCAISRAPTRMLARALRRGFMASASAASAGRIEVRCARCGDGGWCCCACPCARNSALQAVPGRERWTCGWDRLALSPRRPPPPPLGRSLASSRRERKSTA